MKQIRLLKHILRQTGADKIWTGFAAFFLVCAALIWLSEPTVTTHMARALSILLSIYAVLVIAIVTGVIVNYYNQLAALRQKESLAALMNQLERLPELSREELEQIACQVRDYQGK